MRDRCTTRVLVTLFTLLTLMMPLAGDALARQQEAAAPEVIAQRVDRPPRRSAAWRITEREVSHVSGGPGFVLPAIEPLDLIRDAGRQTYLAPGEAAFLAQGEWADVMGTNGGRVPIETIELAPAGYAAPSGDRSIELPRETLSPGESTFVDPGAGNDLFAVTEGTIELRSGRGSETVAPGSATNLLDNAELVADGSAPATFLQARVGAASQTATPAPTSGEIVVTLHVCPAGMRPLDFQPAACPTDPTVADLQIFILGSGEHRRDLTEATRDGAIFTWDDLPFGEYVLQAAQFAEGYDRYLIPSLREGLNIAPDMGYTAGPNEGYLLPLEAEQTAYGLDVYVFRPFAGSGAAWLDLRFWQCPAGVSAASDMRDRGCTPLASPPAGLSLEITGSGVPHPLRLEQATIGASGDLGWSDVPSGEYRLTAQLPAGTPGYAARSTDPALRVMLLSDHSGYALILDPGRPRGNAALDIYLLR